MRKLLHQHPGIQLHGPVMMDISQAGNSLSIIAWQRIEHIKSGKQPHTYFDRLVYLFNHLAFKKGCHWLSIQPLLNKGDNTEKVRQVNSFFSSFSFSHIFSIHNKHSLIYLAFLFPHLVTNFVFEMIFGWVLWMEKVFSSEECCLDRIGLKAFYWSFSSLVFHLTT